MTNEEIQKLIATVLKTQKPWLNSDEMETEYYISKSSQAKMRMNRTIPFHKVGKYIRYYRPDIDQMFLDAKVV